MRYLDPAKVAWPPSLGGPGAAPPLSIRGFPAAVLSRLAMRSVDSSQSDRRPPIAEPALKTGKQFRG